jgi:DNA-binding transcriptional ArsR family regulator
MQSLTKMQFGRVMVDPLPPHSIEAEESVLGSALIDGAAMERIGRRLTPADFFIQRHAWVWSVLRSLLERQAPIDLVTVARELQARGQLDELGGPAMLMSLINRTPTAINAEGYADIVCRLSMRRQTLSALNDAAQAIYDEANDEIEVLHNIGQQMAGLRLAAVSRLSNPDVVLSWSQILRTDYPEPPWVVPEMMTAGLGFLSGKQKVGKSWLGLQLACAKGAGGRFLNYAVKPGPVLYCALEDTPRRIKNRAQRQRWEAGTAIDFMFNQDFERQIGNIASGGADNLGLWISRHGYQLVVIDTFNRAIGRYFKGGEVNDASVVTRALDRLQQVALENNAAVLIIDHHSKAISNEGGDPMNDMLGSVAKGATADFAWSLYRERGKSGARLQITGRDMEEKDLLLNWDREFGIWQYEGDGSTLKLTLRREEIIDFLKKHGRSTLRAVADGIGQPKSHTSERLKDLVKAGLVRRSEEGENVFFESMEDAN